MNYHNQKDTNNQDNNNQNTNKKGNKRKEWDFDKGVNLYYLIYSIIVFIFIVAVFIYLVYLTQAHAKDLGKYGNTYVISEPDILEDINNKLARHERSGRLEEFNKNYRNEVQKQIKQPNRVLGITNATESKTRKFDPTTELEEDIVVPKNNKETNPDKIEYTILHKAGTKINPLDYMLFNEPLIFIDGEIEAQREFANKHHDNSPLSKIILINGKTGIQKAYHRYKGDKEYYYYFDQWGAYSSRFNISVVPSIVYQKEGEKVLTIEEINNNGG